MQENNNGQAVATTGGAVVVADKDATHAGAQNLLLDKIGATWRREESDRISGWYSLSRMAAEYVNADLLHSGNGAKTFSASCQKLTAYLSDFTDDAKASVSRLLATSGLFTLMREWYVDNFSEEEADDLTNENMDGLTVSLLKSLVRLIERDKDTPAGLVYVWTANALDKGPSAVSDCYGDGWTVAQCRDKVDAILAPTEEDADGEEEEDAKQKERKAASQKGSNGINNALKTAGKNGVRKDALRRAVTTEALTPEDAITIVSALTEEGLEKFVAGLTVKRLTALYSACRERAEAMQKAAQPTGATVAVASQN